MRTTWGMFTELAKQNFAVKNYPAGIRTLQLHFTLLPSFFSHLQLDQDFLKFQFYLDP